MAPNWDGWGRDVSLMGAIIAYEVGLRRTGIGEWGLPVGVAKVGTELAVGYFGRGYKATVAREPLFDAGQERLKG